LRHSQEQLSTERATLLAKNEQARSRVEAMIQRLKSLEQNA
jgi:cell division protein ZapB